MPVTMTAGNEGSRAHRHPGDRSLIGVTDQRPKAWATRPQSCTALGGGRLSMSVPMPAQSGPLA